MAFTAVQKNWKLPIISISDDYLVYRGRTEYATKRYDNRLI